MKYIKRIVMLIHGLAMTMCVFVALSMSCAPQEIGGSWLCLVIALVMLCVCALLGPVFGEEIIKWCTEEP